MSGNKLGMKMSLEQTPIEYYENLDVENCLILFKRYAPYSLQHKKAEEIWKVLQKHLTQDEVHALFIAWKDLHYHNRADEFYGKMHELIEKYS